MCNCDSIVLKNIKKCSKIQKMESVKCKAPYKCYNDVKAKYDKTIHVNIKTLHFSTFHNQPRLKSCYF